MGIEDEGSEKKATDGLPSAANELRIEPRERAGIEVWSPVNAIEFGWNTFMRRPWTLIAVVVIHEVVTSSWEVFNRLLWFFRSDQTDLTVDDAWRQLLSSLIGEPAELIPTEVWTLVWGSVLTGCVAVVFVAYITVGFTGVVLKAARGEPFSIGDVFSGRHQLFHMLALIVLQKVAVAIGILLCIVPGVILSLGWSFTEFLMVDRKLGPIASLKESWRLTTGQKGELFIFSLLSSVVTFVGLLCLCVGIIPAYAVTSIARAFIYCRITDADRALQTPPTVTMEL